MQKFYDNIKTSGLDYGPNFRCLQDIWKIQNESMAFLKLPKSLSFESEQFYFHPALLDACLHLIFADVQKSNYAETIYLPDSIKKFKILGAVSESVWSHVKIKKLDSKYLIADIFSFNEDNVCVAEFENLTCKALSDTVKNNDVYEDCYEFQWNEESKNPLTKNTAIRNVVFFGDSELNEYIKGQLNPNEHNIHALSSRDLYSKNDYLNVLKSIPFGNIDTTTSFIMALPNKISSWTENSMSKEARELLLVLQAIDELRVYPYFTLVTREATFIAEQSSVNIDQSPFLGLLRVIMNECPTLPLKMIDISLAPSQQDQILLVKELFSSNQERDEKEIGYRAGKRYVLKMSSIDAAVAEEAATLELKGVGGNFRADVTEPGLRTYLGLGIHGFPNLFTICGPGSPSVLTNMMVAIEQHVDWVGDCLGWMRTQGHQRIEASASAERNWVEYVNAVADSTLYPGCNSWYLGANIPGKTRGVPTLRSKMRGCCCQCL